MDNRFLKSNKKTDFEISNYNKSFSSTLTVRLEKRHLMVRVCGALLAFLAIRALTLLLVAFFVVLKTQRYYLRVVLPTHLEGTPLSG
ncbi:MAG: hypothetical protein K9H48_19945 [Melioribacteraceae bacterium]|nr:hypothetical protein [Melioribacteraceae bacterium]